MAASMANHASTRTTQLYDRRSDEVTLDEVERVGILSNGPVEEQIKWAQDPQSASYLWPSDFDLLERYDPKGEIAHAKEV
jgi:hypothetical protein